MTGLGPTTGRKLLKYHYSGLLQQTAHHDDGSCSPASSLCSPTNNLWKLISLDMSRSRPVPVVRSALRAFGLHIQKRKMQLKLLTFEVKYLLIGHSSFKYYENIDEEEVTHISQVSIMAKTW